VPDGNSPTGRPPAREVRPTAPGDPGSVHVMVAPSRTRIVLCGEIDAALGAELHEAAVDAEAARRPVEVDARRVTFMDSSGFTLLARLAHRGPGRLRIIEPPDVVRFLLDVTTIRDLVDVIERDPGFDEEPPDGSDDPLPDLVA